MTITAEQAFDLDGFFAGDKRYKDLVLDALGLEKIEDLPKERYDSLKELLEAMQETVKPGLL